MNILRSGISRTRGGRLPGIKRPPGPSHPRSCVQNGKKLFEPFDMGAPRRGGYEHAVGDGSRKSCVDIFRAGGFDFGFHRRIGVDFPPFDNTGGGQKLRSVTNCRNRFSGLGKGADQFQHPAVQAQMLGRTAAGQHKSVESVRAESVASRNGNSTTLIGACSTAVAVSTDSASIKMERDFILRPSRPEAVPDRF